jgi:hypothetical protein
MYINNTYYWRKAKSLYKVANFQLIAIKIILQNLAILIQFFISLSLRVMDLIQLCWLLIHVARRYETVPVISADFTEDIIKND